MAEGKNLKSEEKYMFKETEDPTWLGLVCVYCTL